jgi:sortase A
MSVSSAEPTTGTSESGGTGGGPPTTEPDEPTRPRREPVRQVIREVGLALITAGVVVLLFVAYQLFGTNIAEANSQQKLKQQFNHLVAPAVVPPTPGSTAPAETVPSPTAPTGEAIAHLVIPKIGVDKFIVEGVTLAQLRKGPGHYPQTPMPGQPGNAAIAGHRTTYGAPFYRVNELHAGDDIYVTTVQGKFHYSVAEVKVVSPDAVNVLDPTPDNRLTLTTCNPRFSAAQRLVVVGHLSDPPATAPVRVAPPSVAARQLPVDLGSGDSTAWPPTLLFGTIALLLWVGVRLWGARARRGRRWLPYAAGIPVCLVPLWFAFENVIRLLPANI